MNRAMRIVAVAALAVCAIGLSHAATAAARVEAALANPPATGLLIIQTMRDSEAEKKGLREGDVVTKYAGTALATVAQLIEVIARRKQSPTNEVEFVREGKPQALTVEGGTLGIRTARVEKGKPKWKPARAFSGATVRIALTGEQWMAFRMGSTHVGFDFHTVKESADGYALDYRVAFEGSGFDERFIVNVRTGRGGPLAWESLRFASRPDLRFVVEARRAGARIVGKRLGKAESIAAPSDVVPSYAVADLVTTLPLNAGFVFPFTVFEEADFRIQHGHELVCGGKEKVQVGGKSVEAWKFEDRQYGEPGKTYWVGDQRRLVRAAWGNDATSVLSTKDEALRGVASKLKKIL